MHRILFAAAFCVWTGGAMAQTGSAPSAGSQTSPGAAPPGSTRAPLPTTIVPGAAPPSGAAAPSNSQTAPSSRQLPSAAPSASSPTPSGAGGSTPQGGTASPGAPAARDPNLPATASGGSAQRTGKNPITERYADCVKLWDNHTHMSKTEWSRTCRRIENRLQNLRVDNMDLDVSGPKPRRTGKSPGSG
jgi:hypothetical protein